jgi:hypothetical protein
MFTSARARLWRVRCVFAPLREIFEPGVSVIED